MARYSVNKHLKPGEPQFGPLDMISFLLEMKETEARRDLLTSGKARFHVEPDPWIEIDDDVSLPAEIVRLMLEWGFQQDT